MPVVDFYLPAIKTDSGMGEILLPFWGDVYLKLGISKYCTNCHKPNRTGGLLCEECEAGGTGKFFRCLFGKTIENCTPEHPACEFAENHRICFNPYVVYVGRIGKHYKVGITPRYRDGSPEGYLFRLIEQGLSEAAVFAGKGLDLTLPEATALEAEISEIFRIPTAISFKSKISAVWEESNGENNSDIFDEITRVFEQIERIDHVSLAHNYILPDNFRDFQEFTWSNKFIISGKVVGFWGPLLFIKGHNNGWYKILNAQSMVGRMIHTSV